MKPPRLQCIQADKPTVFVNTAYEGAWYMPGGESYAAILLRDAGATTCGTT